MKASELITALETEMKLRGDIDIMLAVNEDVDGVELAGIATQFEEDGTTPTHFLLCDDDVFDTFHVGGDDEPTESVN